MAAASCCRWQRRKQWCVYCGVGGRRCAMHQGRETTSGASSGRGSTTQFTKTSHLAGEIPLTLHRHTHTCMHRMNPKTYGTDFTILSARFRNILLPLIIVRFYTEPSLWSAQLYGTVYQQQFVKLTACICSDASSKRICLLYVLMTE